MTHPKLSPERLQMWLDGELSENEAVELEGRLAHEPEAEALVKSVRAVGDHVREWVDGGMGEVEPLRALQSIRQRIAEEEAASPMARLGRWWHDLWAFNRKALAGVGMAAALGAASAPGLMYWLGGPSSQGTAPMASVVVESLEFSGNATAMVYRPTDSATTIIWVEPNEKSRQVQ